MAVKTFSIEIIVDHYDDKKDDIIKEMVRVHAKQLLTGAMLLQDRRPPQVKVESGDHFEATQEIMLVDAEVDESLVETPEAKAEGALTDHANRARTAGYTVSEKDGWRFNDPNGVWGSPHPNEPAAWEAAYDDLTQST